MGGGSSREVSCAESLAVRACERARVKACRGARAVQARKAKTKETEDVCFVCKDSGGKMLCGGLGTTARTTTTLPVIAVPTSSASGC